MLEIFLKKLNTKGTPIRQDSVVNCVCEFNYNPDEEVTFSLYYRHYEDIFWWNCPGWTDERKVCLLLSKLCPVEHEKYVNYILLKKPTDIPFEETILLLEKIFSDKSSLFNTCSNCLNFKIFCPSLMSNKDAEIWAQILRSHEHYINLKLQKVV